MSYLIKEGGQSYYTDSNGKKQLSLINKRADEGDWEDWSDKLSSQFLSKQNIALAKKQLDLAASDKQSEFDDILSLTNPTVKKVLLQSFSDDCDSAAVHLKAAALPRQKCQEGVGQRGQRRRGGELHDSALLPWARPPHIYRPATGVV